MRKVDIVLLPGHLTKNSVVSIYSEVFNSPVESLPGKVHFDLDPDVKPVNVHLSMFLLLLKLQLRLSFLNKALRRSHYIMPTL